SSSCPRATSSRSSTATKTPRSGSSGPGYICETSRIRTGPFSRGERARAIRRLGRLRGEDAGEVSDRRVAGAQRLELVAVLEGGQDRRRVVLDVVDDVRGGQERREDERRDTRP